MGWSLADTNESSVYLDVNNWKDKVSEVIDSTPDALHLFNGIRTFEKLSFALSLIRTRNMRYGFLAEAPFNPYRNFGIRFMKFVYSNYIIGRFRKTLIHDSECYINLSGGKNKELINQGWPKNKIYPFGYFTEQSKLLLEKSSMSKDYRIVMTGYITKNKGHLRVLRALKKVGSENIKVAITGFGPELETLKKYVRLHSLDYVDFKGVLSDLEVQVLYQNSDLLIAGGYEEPWGIRVNEALNNGCLVLVSSGIGACQLIELGRNGYIFNTNDQLDLEDKLSFILSNRVQVEDWDRNVISPLKYRERLEVIINDLNELNNARLSS